MPLDPTPYLDPAHCAVLVFECQEHVIGEKSPLQTLVAAVREVGMLDVLPQLLDSARRAGAMVCYCKAESRPDGLGAAKTPFMDRLAATRATSPTPDDTSVLTEIAPQPGDVVVSRSHGMSGFYDAGLDPCLRDRDTRTVVLTGVSLNIGILGTAVEAVNRGYRVVVARDCVAGDPPEYGEQVLRYSLRNLAYVVEAREIAEAWKAPLGG